MFLGISVAVLSATKIMTLTSYQGLNVRSTWSIVRASESFLYDNRAAGCSVSVSIGRRVVAGGGRAACPTGDTTAN